MNQSAAADTAHPTGSLPVQSIHLAQGAELGTNWLDVLNSDQPPLRVTGYAYAFRLAPFLKSSTAEGLGWHRHLLQRTILGLHAQRSRQSLVVGYQLLAQFIRVVVCARRTTTWPKFSRLMTALPGYLEAGYDSVPVTALRYSACWLPPDQAVALWPTGLAGETDGLRVVDTGNLLGYFSAEVGAELLPTLDPRDYVIVPTERDNQLQWRQRTYAYQNRWLALTV